MSHTFAIYFKYVNLIRYNYYFNLSIYYSSYIYHRSIYHIIDCLSDLYFLIFSLEICSRMIRILFRAFNPKIMSESSNSRYKLWHIECLVLFNMERKGKEYLESSEVAFTYILRSHFKCDNTFTYSLDFRMTIRHATLHTLEKQTPRPVDLLSQSKSFIIISIKCFI